MSLLPWGAGHFRQGALSGAYRHCHRHLRLGYGQDIGMPHLTLSLASVWRLALETWGSHQEEVTAG